MCWGGSEHPPSALCISLHLPALSLSGGGGCSQPHPQSLSSIPGSRARPVPAGPQAAARWVRKITFTGRKLPALWVLTQRVYEQTEETALNRISSLSGLFCLLRSQGSCRFRELRGTRKPLRSFCWGAAWQVQLWGCGGGSVCPTALGTGSLALSDKYVSCHFSEKAVCELLLLRGSRGKYTQPLAPSPFLSPQGRVSALYLGEENLQPQEEAEKKPLSWNSCLQILYLSNNWGVLPQQLLCNSEWSEET